MRNILTLCVMSYPTHFWMEFQYLYFSCFKSSDILSWTHVHNNRLQIHLRIIYIYYFLPLMFWDVLFQKNYRFIARQGRVVLLLLYLVIFYNAKGTVILACNHSLFVFLFINFVFVVVTFPCLEKLYSWTCFEFTLRKTCWDETQWRF